MSEAQEMATRVKPKVGTKKLVSQRRPWIAEPGDEEDCRADREYAGG